MTTYQNKANLNRGFFRLWLVVSVFWLIGVAAIYRDGNSECSNLIECLEHSYEGANLKAVPEELPLGQDGLRWGNLTWAEFMHFRFAPEPPPPPRSLSPTGADMGTPWDYAEMLEMLKSPEEKARDSDPSRVRFKLIPIDKIHGDDRNNLDDWITSQREGFRRAVGLSVGVPLAVGGLGFLSIWAGRWVWAGFTRAK